MITQTWTVSCDNPSGKCQSRIVVGKPDEPKNVVIMKAFSEFGFRRIKKVDEVGYIDYFVLCGECIKLGRY